MKNLAVKISAVVFYLFFSHQSHSSVLYTFSFENQLGSVAGTVEGTIVFDFLNSVTDSGSGAASQIQITSFPAALRNFVEGDLVNLWQTRGPNLFTINAGVITDYSFGASEGAVPTRADSVFCLNNGGTFSLAGVYICGASENYLGDGFAFVYNTGGISAVSFGPAQQVSAPITLALFSVFSFAIFVRKKFVA